MDDWEVNDFCAISDQLNTEALDGNLWMGTEIDEGDEALVSRFQILDDLSLMFSCRRRIGLKFNNGSSKAHQISIVELLQFPALVGEL